MPWTLFYFERSKTMLKETRTYTDYDGVERTEDFYFALSKAELAEMELSTDGGMQSMIERIINSKDNKKIVEIFKEILLKSYGEKSDDGKRFVKSPELSKAFSETPVYSDMFMELATDEAKASAFIDGILPSDMQAQLAEVRNNKEIESATNA